MKTICKNGGKKVIRFNDTEKEEYEFHRYKSPILINVKDIHKIVVSKSNKIVVFLLVNKILDISLVTKIIKKLKLYSFQK